MNEVMSMEEIKTVDDMIEEFYEAVRGVVYTSAADAYTPKKIIRSGEVTVVFWLDGSKTIVRRDPEDADNLHTAFCAALAKKIFGSNTAVKKTIDRQLARSKEERRRIAYAKAIRAYKHKNHVNEVDSATKVKIYKEVHGIG